MNEILVDTDVVSYLLNRHSLAEEYEKRLIGHTPLVSFMTVAELYRGAMKKKWGQRRMAELQSCLREYAVVPWTFEICIAFAGICNSAEERGKPTSTADALIAACAVSLRMPS